MHSAYLDYMMNSHQLGSEEMASRGHSPSQELERIDLAVVVQKGSVRSGSRLIGAWDGRSPRWGRGRRGVKVRVDLRRHRRQGIECSLCRLGQKACVVDHGKYCWLRRLGSELVGRSFLCRPRGVMVPENWIGNRYQMRCLSEEH